MIALVATVFVASLLGSLHCAGMCGPFVAFGVSGATQRVRLQLAYNGGRLFTYLLLGAAAGALGAALDLGGAWVGIQRAALIVAGASMIAFGLITLARLAGARLRLPGAPRWLQPLYVRGHRLAAMLVPPQRALAIGLLSTLLPCGWLYAFVITAAGTGSASAGALTMAVFWCGTLPVMLALGSGLQALAGPLRSRLPALTAVALVVVGLVAVAGRLEVPAPDLAAVAAEGGAQAAAAQAAELTPSESCPLHGD